MGIMGHKLKKVPIFGGGFFFVKMAAEAQGRG